MGPKGGLCRGVGAGDDVTAKDALGPGVPGPLCMGPQSSDRGGGPTAKAKLVHPKDGGPQPVIGPWVPLAPIRSVSGHPTPFVAACLGIGQEATKTQLLQVIAESSSFRC